MLSSAGIATAGHHEQFEAATFCGPKLMRRLKLRVYSAEEYVLRAALACTSRTRFVAELHQQSERPMPFQWSRKAFCLFSVCFCVGIFLLPFCYNGQQLAAKRRCVFSEIVVRAAHWSNEPILKERKKSKAFDEEKLDEKCSSKMRLGRRNRN